MNRGFTLLEVLIALAILSTVALLAVRVSGDSLTQLAETGWEDVPRFSTSRNSRRLPSMHRRAISFECHSTSGYSGDRVPH